MHGSARPGKGTSFARAMTERAEGRRQEGWTPLLRAAESGHAAVAELLLAARAEVGARLPVNHAHPAPFPFQCNSAGVGKRARRRGGGGRHR